ncbi:hypothetical protein Tco_0546190 [Tanacetum coccineum]
MYCSIVFLPAIASASSSSEYSWSESRLKSGDLNSSRLRVLKCLFDDQNSRSDDRYTVSNGGGYAVLISWDEYDVLDRELDMPYRWHVYAVSSLMDTPYWSSEQTINQMEDLVKTIEERADFDERRSNTRETRANMEQRRANLEHARVIREHDRENKMRTYLMLSWFFFSAYLILHH